MAKIGISARGQVVDFDLLEIKQQLANQPVSVSTQQRRKFIDEKDSVKSRVIDNEVIIPSGEVAQNTSKKTKKDEGQ